MIEDEHEPHIPPRRSDHRIPLRWRLIVPFAGLIAIFLAMVLVGWQYSLWVAGLGALSLALTLYGFWVVRTNWVRHTAVITRLLMEHGGQQQHENPPEHARLSDFTDALERVLERHEQSVARLQESDERWRAALRANGEGIWDLNLRTGAVFLSPRWKHILGYEDHELPNVWETWTDLIHPSDLQMALAENERCLRGETPEHRVEFRMRHRSGEYRWILSRAVALRNAQGQVVRLIGSHADITDAYQSRQALSRMLALLDHTQAIAKVGGWELDLKTERLFWTDAVFQILGLPVSDEAPELCNCLARFAPEAARAIKLAATRTMASGEPWDLTLPLELAGGETRWVRLIGSPVSAEGAIRFLRGALADVTSQRRAAQSLIQSEHLFRSVFDSAHDGILVAGASGLVERANPAALGILGLDAAGSRRPIHELLPGIDWTRIHETQEMDVGCADGHVRPLEVSFAALELDGEGKIALHLRDHSERRASQSIIFELAHRDLLTRLPNRRLYLSRLEEALHLRPDAPAVGVLHLDLDNFKIVNDSLGHEVGDDLLLESARRITQAAGDRGLVARLGGDEFAVLVVSTANDQELTYMARRILEALAEPYHLAGQLLYAGASIGIARADRESGSPEILMRRADLAMHHAKTMGKAGFAHYEPVMSHAASQRMEIEANLRQALDRGEFSLVYQPIIRLATGHVVGAEALLRWHNASLGPVPPTLFIPVAEEVGLIPAIGAWVTEAALREVSGWMRSKLVPRDFEISVNVSGRQLAVPGFVSEVLRLLQKCEVSPSNLKLEITESVAVADVDSTLLGLAELRNHGVRIAIDDFGTGYSSMSILGQLPVDTVKIDRSFVDRLGQDVQPTAVIHALIALCGKLGKSTTGEGIETEAQAAQLREIGCDFGQGYLFSRPLKPEAFLEWHRSYLEGPQAA